MSDTACERGECRLGRCAEKVAFLTQPVEYAQAARAAELERVRRAADAADAKAASLPLPKGARRFHIECPYCRGPARYRPTSGHLYFGQHDYGPVWECAPCNAWVGTHPTGAPLGRLANKALRRAKQRAHAAFDPLWKAAMQRDGLKAGHARNRGYKWLAAQMGMDRKTCHIGLFDEAQCERVAAICSRFAAGAERTLRGEGGAGHRGDWRHAEGEPLRGADG